MMSNVLQFPDWRTHLLRGDKNQLLAVAHNAALLIDCGLNHLCAYDELMDQPVLVRPPPVAMNGQPPQPGPYPRPWMAFDIGMILAFLQSTESSAFKANVVEEGMVIAAAGRRYHPIRDYLDGLKWDGIPRIDDWLIYTFDAPETDFVRAAGKAFLIGAVRRIRRPGCKHDAMLVFVGDQGIGKSKVCRSLFQPDGSRWFTDYLPADLKDRNTLQALQGMWGVEFAELDQLVRSEAETVKAFLSRQDDRYFARYGKQIIEVPRQCVFVGTSNRTDYLRDETGNRRFWPVECRIADVAWIEANRDQLWAEACVCEARGDQNWLDASLTHQAEDVQSAHVAEDTWDDPLRHWLNDGRVEVTTADALFLGIGMPRERQDARATKRVSACLRRLGWKQHVKGRGKTSRRVWMKQEAQP